MSPTFKWDFLAVFSTFWPEIPALSLFQLDQTHCLTYTQGKIDFVRPSSIHFFSVANPSEFRSLLTIFLLFKSPVIRVVSKAFGQNKGLFY